MNVLCGAEPLPVQNWIRFERSFMRKCKGQESMKEKKKKKKKKRKRNSEERKVEE